MVQIFLYTRRLIPQDLHVLPDDDLPLSLLLLLDEVEHAQGAAVALQQVGEVQLRRHVARVHPMTCHNMNSGVTN